MQNILIIRLSALGDVIFALPALAMLRDLYPGAGLTWVVEDKAASLLLRRKDLLRVVVYPRKAIREAARNPLKWPRLAAVLFRHARELRKIHYDMTLDLQGNFKSGMHSFLARASRKIGFDRGQVKELNHLFTSEHVSPPGWAVHRIERCAALVKPGFSVEDIRRPELYLPEEVLEEARKSIGSVRRSGGPLMILHPGTSAFGAFKRWAPERFGMLARRMHEEHGFESLVTWGPGERPLAAAVAEAGGEGVVVAPESQTLLHLAAYIGQGDVYVSADSGPLHLANYLGIPCLALFGPKDPALYRPYFPPSRVVQARVECSPCARRHCDDPICMKRLEVQEVYEALCGLLEDARMR